MTDREVRDRHPGLPSVMATDREPPFVPRMHPSARCDPLDTRGVADAADDERALVQRAQAGDREAWAALCRSSAPRLAAYLGARLGRPAVIEKLIGDVIVAAWRKLPELQDAG